ncbi:DUF1850 domain-containing protein [Geosporobacter ferrireducens]|uniref:DUF1850 domain-containing protein n=1 Tax=Geosporobacter ferrireducens TaxID=1424294 RepID=UPI0023547709|nr:DUF1850 domain-containing protein [Geosporobacter ferrireducens]
MSIFAFVVLLFLFKISEIQRLSIINQNTNKVYLTTEVVPGDKLTYGWIHSLEHIPWTEDYYIQKNNHLLLYRITLSAFGAGIPHNKGKLTRVEDGTIVMEEINEDFEEINWIHSQTATEYIQLNDQTLIKGVDLPHHEALKLKIEKRLKLCRRSQ